MSQSWNLIRIELEIHPDGRQWAWHSAVRRVRDARREMGSQRKSNRAEEKKNAVWRESNYYLSAEASET